MKKENAITLVALVISIIILIILASVTINTLINNGIIDKAKTATQEYKNAQNYEETQIAKYTNDINSYVSGNRDYETEINKLSARITELENANLNSHEEIDLSTIDSAAKGQITINNKVVTINAFISKSVVSNGTILTLPDNLKPSSNKIGSGLIYDSSNGWGSSAPTLDTSGRFINDSSVTRTYFIFFITYLLD